MCKCVNIDGAPGWKQYQFCWDLRDLFPSDEPECCQKELREDSNQGETAAAEDELSGTAHGFVIQ